jgi:uncharacterized phage protein (TIGR02218 family)
MRTVSAELDVFLRGTTALYAMRHLVTMTMRAKPTFSGGAWSTPAPPVYRWTDHHANLEVGGLTYERGGEGTTNPIPRVGKGREQLGVVISSRELALECGDTATIGGVRATVLAMRKGLDGAKVRIDRVYMPADGDVSLGAMHVFEGYVGETRVINGTVVVLTVESGIAQLAATQIPRRAYQAGCSRSLYDSGCGVSKNTWTDTGTAVAAGSTTTVIRTSLTRADGYFALGSILFQTGANAGEQRQVVSYLNANGAVTVDRPLLAVPALGDSFAIYPGCNKVLLDASMGCLRFSNSARHNGFPFAPRVEVMY